MEDIGIEKGPGFSSENYVEIIGEKLILTKITGFQKFPLDRNYELALNEEKLDEACDSKIQYIDLPEEANCYSDKRTNVTYNVGDIDDCVASKFEEDYEKGGLLVSEDLAEEWKEETGSTIRLNFSCQRFRGNTDPEVKSARLDQILEKRKS